VDNNANFSSPLVNRVLTATRYTLTTSLPDRTYYWRVQARDEFSNWGHWSDRWSFTVDAISLAAPTLNNPEDETTLNNNRPVFSWRAVAGATSYTLQVDNQSNFASPAINRTVTTTRYATTTSLAQGTYFWRVRAQDDTGHQSPWSSVWHFTIAGAEVQPLSPAATSTPTLVPTAVPTTLPTAAPTNTVIRPAQLIETTDPVVVQTGAWTTHTTDAASGGSYLYSSGSFEDVLSLNFVGTQVEVIYVKHPALGTFAMEIDGAVMQLVDSVAAESQFGAAALVSGLADGAHTLRIYPVAGVVALDAFGIDALPSVIIPTPTPTDLPPVQPTIVPTNEPTQIPTATNTPLSITLPFVDTFDSGLNWQATGTWTFDTQTAYRGAGWFASSAARSQISTLTFGASLDLRMALNPELSFWQKEALSASDLVAVEVSLDGGLSWLPVDQQIGQASAWIQHTLDLTPYSGYVLALRFRLDTMQLLPEGMTSIGLWIDELVIQEAQPSPTDVPTATPVPPTSVPTNTPVPPTELPTEIPTDIPTNTPMPTEMPTSTPVPSETPLPSATPTEVPLETPVLVPTEESVS
jgi:hypothetical protein